MRRIFTATGVPLRSAEWGKEGHLFATSEDGTVFKVDSKAGEILAVKKLEDSPFLTTISRFREHLAVLFPWDKKICFFDENLHLVNEISLGEMVEPYWMAVSGGRIFVVDREENIMVAIDPASGAVMYTYFDELIRDWLLKEKYGLSFSLDTPIFPNHISSSGDFLLVCFVNGFAVRIRVKDLEVDYIVKKPDIKIPICGAVAPQGGFIVWDIADRRLKVFEKDGTPPLPETCTPDVVDIKLGKKLLIVAGSEVWVSDSTLKPEAKEKPFASFLFFLDKTPSEIRRKAESGPEFIGQLVKKAKSVKDLADAEELCKEIQEIPHESMAMLWKLRGEKENLAREIASKWDSVVAESLIWAWENLGRKQLASYLILRMLLPPVIQGLPSACWGMPFPKTADAFVRHIGWFENMATPYLFVSWSYPELKYEKRSPRGCVGPQEREIEAVRSFMADISKALSNPQIGDDPEGRSKRLVETYCEAWIGLISLWRKWVTCGDRKRICEAFQQSYIHATSNSKSAHVWENVATWQFLRDIRFFTDVLSGERGPGELVIVSDYSGRAGYILCGNFVRLGDGAIVAVDGGNGALLSIDVRKGTCKVLTRLARGVFSKMFVWIAQDRSGETLYMSQVFSPRVVVFNMATGTKRLLQLDLKAVSVVPVEGRKLLLSGEKGNRKGIFLYDLVEGKSKLLFELPNPLYYLEEARGDVIYARGNAVDECIVLDGRGKVKDKFEGCNLRAEICGKTVEASSIQGTVIINGKPIFRTGSIPFLFLDRSFEEIDGKLVTLDPLGIRILYV